MKKFEQEITTWETILQRQSNDMQAYFDRNTYGVGSAHPSDPMHRCRDKEHRPEELGTRNLIQSDDDISDVSGSWPAMPNEDDCLLMKNTPIHRVSTSKDGEINRKIGANVSNINQDNSKDESYTVGPLLRELVKQQALNSLPKQQPPVFTGNYFDYPYFITAFESRVKDPQQRLYYLNQFTNGEAREVIKGLVTLNSPEAYVKARSLLKERFGPTYRVAHAYKEKLMNWTAIKDAGEGTLLLKFSDFLVQAEEAMKTLQYMDILNNEDTIKKICSKLPNFSIARWCCRANEILVKGETVKFHDFMEFVKAAAFSTNPVFSPSSLGKNCPFKKCS